MTGFLIRIESFGHGETQGRKPREDGGRNWSEKSIREGMPRVAGSSQKRGGKHDTLSPLKPQRKS